MNQPQSSRFMTFGLRSVALASALCCASLAQAQTSSVTLYGIVDAAFVSTTNQAGGTKNAIDAGQLATSRWGVKGAEDLGGGLKATFNLEGTLANDTGAAGSSYGGGFVSTGTTTNLFDRASVVGLAGGFGAVNLGRQNHLGVEVLAYNDPSGFAHAATNPNVVYGSLNSGALFGPYGANSGGTGLRQNNSVRYDTPNFAGFSAAAMYAFGENATATTSASYYSGVSGAYANGPVGVNLAYARLTNGPTVAPLPANSTMTLTDFGARYAFSAVTLKATYSQSEVDALNQKIAVAGLGIDYRLSAATTLTAAYYDMKLTGAASGKADQFLIMGQYALSKRTTTYATLTHAKANSSGAADLSMSGGMVFAGNTDATRVALGIKHAF
jgi:predicted porin